MNLLENGQNGVNVRQPVEKVPKPEPKCVQSRIKLKPKVNLAQISHLVKVNISRICTLIVKDYKCFYF